MKNRLLLMVSVVALLLVAPALAGCDFPGLRASGSRNQQNTGTTATPIAKGTPGVLTSENPAADEAMEAIKSEGVPMATEKEGGQPLAFRMEGGVKVFDLTAKAVKWPILNGVVATAYTYNGMVPGPLIRVTEATGFGWC